MLYSAARRGARKGATTATTPAVAVPAGYKLFQSKEFGVEFSCHVPEDWEDDVEPQLMHLIWQKTGVKLPVLTFQRVDLPPGKSLDEYLQFFQQQSKAAFGKEMTIANTTIAGYDARRAMTVVPIAQDLNGKALLLWTLIDATLYHFAFLSEDDFSEEYKTELNTVIKSIKFGDKRGEHIKLRPNQLQSGFVLSTASDWILDENDTSSGVCSTLSYTTSSQAKLETFNANLPLDEDLNSFIQKIAYPDAQVVSTKKDITIGALTGAIRVEFQLPPTTDETPNYGFLYLANVDSEWFMGGVCLSYIFNKKDGDLTPFDICERSAATLLLPIDPLDEGDRDLSLDTYENLNFGYRLKFDPSEFNVIKLGWTARVQPVGTRAVLKMVQESGGGITLNFHRILSTDAGMSVGDYCDKMIEAFQEDPSLEFLDRTDIEIANAPGKRLIIRNKQLQEQVVIFLARNEKFWITFQWSSLVSESGIDKERVEKVINSFEFVEEQ